MPPSASPSARRCSRSWAFSDLLLFLELTVRTVTRTLTTNQVRRAGKQGTDGPELSRIHSRTQHPRDKRREASAHGALTGQPEPACSSCCGRMSPLPAGRVAVVQVPPRAGGLTKAILWKFASGKPLLSHLPAQCTTPSFSSGGRRVPKTRPRRTRSGCAGPFFFDSHVRTSARRPAAAWSRFYAQAVAAAQSPCGR